MAGGLSNYLQLRMLDAIYGITAFTPPATVHYALFTVAPTGAGGGTEAAGGGYARAPVTNNTTHFPNATGGSPALKTTGTVVTFPTPTTDWSSGDLMVAYGRFDAASGGNLLDWAELLSLYTDVVPDESTDVLNATGHPFNDNDAVRVRVPVGTIPTGLSTSVKYYVRDRAANSFKLALTQGGAAVTFSTNGNGRILVAKDGFKQALAGDPISFPVGELDLFLNVA